MQRRAVGNPGGFCVLKVDMRKETAPARTARRGRLCQNSRLDGALGARLASRGSCTRQWGRPPLAPIALGMRRALRLGLRIANSLSQQLAQLGLGLRRFSRKRFLPLDHKQHVGTHEADLNPAFEDNPHLNWSSHSGLTSDIA
jgi:hypothetical protein